MRKVYQGGKLRKTELHIGDDGYTELFKKMRVYLDFNVPSGDISYDNEKKEYSMYFFNNGSVDRLGTDAYLGNTDECIMIALKYNTLSKQYRAKKYYKGNYLGIDTHDIVFHTGVCPMTGEYTLYVFENQTKDDVKLGFAKQSYANYIGRTFTKDGEFIRESRYIHES